MVLEEYGPELIYIKGQDNVVADALSRLDLIPDPEEVSSTKEHDDVTINDYMNIHRDELPEDIYPLRMSLISAEQRKDVQLQAATNKPNSKYTHTKVRGGRTDYDIIECNGKIVVPTTLRKRMLTWYHDTLMHPGITRMTKTIRLHFTWPNLDKQVENYCKQCSICQQTKKTKKK